MIKVIIFDMNGVIVDDEHLHELAFQQVCQRIGVTLTHEDYLLMCAGRTDRAGFTDVLKKNSLLSLDIDELLISKSDAYLELIPGNIKSFSGCLEFISEIRKKHRLALTSSSSMAEIQMILENMEIEDAFEVIVSADDVKNGKPDPEPYLLTAKKLNIEPKYCLVIEDTVNGIKSAKAAGMQCIAITTTHNKNDLAQADFVIDDFNSVEAILQQ